MELRETKLTPLSDGKTLVEITYSDHADLERATTYLVFQRALELRPRTSIAGAQHHAFQALFEWAHEESNRLHGLMTSG